MVLYFILEFRSGKSPLLVATDVASRGLGMYASSVGLDLQADGLFQFQIF